MASVVVVSRTGVVIVAACRCEQPEGDQSGREAKGSLVQGSLRVGSGIRPHSSHPVTVPFRQGRRVRFAEIRPATGWRVSAGADQTRRPWRGSWSPRRSPTAGSIASAPPATRSTSSSTSRPEQLVEAVRGAHALIIRSATTVTADVLAAGQDLVVVGRAGIGLDNVDTDAATTQGVMVVNAPQSNILTTAEHTMALLLAQARNIPQAHAALDRGSVGAQPLGRRGAGRQGARHRRPRPHRQAGGPASLGVRDEGRGARPLRRP